MGEQALLASPLVPPCVPGRKTNSSEVMLEVSSLGKLPSLGPSFPQQPAQEADIKNMLPHTASAVSQLLPRPSQRWGLLLIIGKRNKMRKRKNAHGLGGFLPFTVLSEEQRRLCPAARLPSARVVSTTPSQVSSWLAYLLATAESWSRIRPRPSNMVSSVSLLSSMVTAEMQGLSPHRLGSS